MLDVIVYHCGCLLHEVHVCLVFGLFGLGRFISSGLTAFVIVCTVADFVWLYAQ